MSVETPATTEWTLVAEAAAGVLPASESLGVLAEQNPVGADDLAGFAGAAVAELAAPAQGRIGLLVTEDLVQALADGPLGELSLASALQPAFDAAGAALGGAAEVAQDVSVEDLVAQLGEDLTLVTLGQDSPAAALALGASVRKGKPVELEAEQPVTVRTAIPASRGLEMLHGVVMDVTVELGRTKLPVRDLLALVPGTVVELDRAAGSPADLLVNGRLIARGEVVVVDEDFGLRITEIVEDAQGVSR